MPPWSEQALPPEIQRTEAGHESGDRTIDRERLSQLALRGVGVIGARSVITRLLAFGSTIVLARLLTPADFGIVALGGVMVAFGTILGDGGIGASLVRAGGEPEPADLESMLGFQAAVSLLLAATVAAVGVNLGTTGRFLALVSVVLPLSAVKTPGTVVLERELAYRPLAVIETTEAIVYYAFALTLVALGASVWGVGVGMIAAAITGSGIMLVIAPAGRVRPRLDWSRLRGQLGFGMRFQAVDLSWVVQQQALNFSVIAITSTATLGVWSLALKAVQLPMLLYETLSRVSFPAMVRMQRAEMDSKPSLERGTRVVAVTSGLLIAVVVGTGPALIPTVFGSQWPAAVSLLPYLGAGLLIGGPVSVAATGYLFARGNTRAALGSALAHAVALLGVTLPLLPLLGAQAIGVGMLIASLAQVVVLSIAVRRASGAHLLIAIVPATMTAAIAAGAGWATCQTLGTSLTTVVIAGAVSTGAYLAIAALAEHRGTQDALRLAHRSLRRAPAEV